MPSALAEKASVSSLRGKAAGGLACPALLNTLKLTAKPLDIRGVFAVCTFLFKDARHDRDIPVIHHLE
ncbi:hypothetical protein [Acetobacter sp.]|uniref:hypothetical protein n=1 Tax=Acetobacter sp. TaxID=440 RepID=UPI0039E8B51A